jgi:signal transduction histidine kinase
LNRELEQFTYTVSHDLKVMLITVRGFLALLEQDLADKDVSRIQEDMDKIRVATTDMKRVVEDLLHLSQIGGSDNPVSDIPFNDVIDDIEERHQERIFDLFQKPDADRAGTSVGLALSKKNVEMHGGRLWVESEGKGCGSRFCFSLPASEQTAGAPG